MGLTRPPTEAALQAALDQERVSRSLGFTPAAAIKAANKAANIKAPA